jgi:Spy/CpxP family protein refolding chaperone
MEAVMFGFLIGTLSLIGLIKVVRHGRGWGGHGSRGGPRRWMLRRLFERLDTTPGQEKVILEAVEQVEQNGRAAKDAFFNGRVDIGRAMRGEHFDTAAVNAAFEKQQEAVDAFKKTVLENMQKIHEALTPEQRQAAGNLIENGPRALHGGGCGHGGGRWAGRGGGYGRGSEASAVNL